MVRKIAIILFIICLDIAFILIVRGDFQPMRLAEVANLEAITSFGDLDQSAVAPPRLDEIDLGVYETRPINSAHASDPRPLRREFTLTAHVKAKPSRSKRPARKPAFASYTSNEPFAGFTDTVIWYDKPGGDRRAGSDRTMAVVPTVAIDVDLLPAKRKRSIFSKAVPIMRKPYDWLRELASELR
jgi:hypothetical protein